jgi:hypothetical protein
VITDANVKSGSLTGASINAGTLGKVPAADSAGHATNSDQLGGAPAPAFQSRVAGTCGANSGITQINANGSVACANVQFYSGRLVEPLNGHGTFLTIPGVAHAISLNCQAANAQAQLVNDVVGTTDAWTGGDTTYIGTNWSGLDDPSAAHFGRDLPSRTGLRRRRQGDHRHRQRPRDWQQLHLPRDGGGDNRRLRGIAERAGADKRAPHLPNSALTLWP